ncbi:MAG: hypothetical protein MK042_14440 [Cognatishimia sp.]|nr:hypothetical protein [Cognatishimia sp.]
MLENYHRTTYNSADIETLISLGRIDCVDTNQFRDDLESFAAIFRWENERFSSPSTFKNTSDELSKIEKQAKRLADSLKQISNEAFTALEKEAFLDEAQMIGKRDDTNLKPSMVLSINDFVDEQNLVGISITIQSLSNILDGLKERAARSKESLTKRGTGKIPDYGLRIWLINIQDSWPRWSKTGFTRDVDSTGQPITPAAQFCVYALQKIDPSYSVSRIVNGMKNLINERNKRSGKIRE